jgi:hypothetical protein
MNYFYLEENKEVTVWCLVGLFAPTGLPIFIPWKIFQLKSRHYPLVYNLVEKLVFSSLSDADVADIDFYGVGREVVVDAYIYFWPLMIATYAIDRVTSLIKWSASRINRWMFCRQKYQQAR